MSQDLIPNDDSIDLFITLGKVIENCLKDNLNPKLVQYVLRKDFHQNHLKQKYHQILKREEFSKLVNIAIRFVYFFKHDQDNTLLSDLEIQLKEQYFHIFANLVQPKDELINFILMIAGFLVHRCIYEMFLDLRQQIDQRYVYEVYHIIVYKCNGILVSDHFIKSQIDAYFNNKYMDYQLSQFELHVIKKKPQIKKFISEQSFIGIKLKFPELINNHENDQFKLKLENLRLRRKQDSLRHIHIVKNQDMDIGLTDQNQVRFKSEHEIRSNLFLYIREQTQIQTRINLNLNQVSPSVSQVLELQENQLQQTRSINVSHRLQIDNQKVDQLIYQEDGKVCSMLLSLKDELGNKIDKKSKLPTLKYKVFDDYNCPQPPPEYFEKHSKVNHLFHSMLEMNHVLQFNKQSYRDLRSPLKSNQDDQSKFRIIEFLKDKERIIIKQKEEDLKKSHEKQFIEQIKLFEIENENIKILKRKSTSMTSSPVKFIQIDQSSTKRDSLLESQLSSRRKSVIFKVQDVAEIQKVKPYEIDKIKWSKGYVYDDKRKFYTKNFEDLVENASTDSKINQIVHNLQVKQNLFSKALGRKIHKS